MDWKPLLASITGSVDEELLRRNEYLVTENRLLRQQLTGRVQLTDAERRSLAEIGKKLGKKALEEVASLDQRAHSNRKLRFRPARKLGAAP
jgi:putative transposase